MKYRQTLIALSLALGLAGCASYPSDVVYRDGSYYSPAADSYGDYYYAPEPRDDYYYGYYGPDFFYGGGYCSVRYSYCPPFWYSQFLAPPFGYGWYEPWGGGFGYGYYYPSPYYYGGHRRGGHDHDHDRDHRGDGRGGSRDPGTGGTASTGDGATEGGPDQAPIRRYRDARDLRWQQDAERRQPMPWRGEGAFPAMPAATEGLPSLRYPAPAPARMRSEPRRVVAEPRRAYPTTVAPRSSESSDSDSSDGDRRADRRRGRGG